MSGNRYALISGHALVSMYRKPYRSESDASRVVARLEPTVIVTLDRCELGWCSVVVSGFRGWVQRKFLWGVYEDEFFE